MTALELITQALRLANIIDQIQAPPAEMGQQARTTMNQMVADWERDGIRIGWAPVAALDDELPIEDADERALKYNLAVELCGEYGLDPSADVSRIRDDTYNRLAKSSADEVVADLSGLPAEDANYYVSWPFS